MGLLISSWFIIQSVLIPDGFGKWRRLSFFIHPSLLVACQIFLVARVLVRWVLLIVVIPLGVISRVILAWFRLFKGWVIGLVLVVVSSVTPSERSAAEDEEYFQDCQEWEDIEIELDPTRTIVPCDQWLDADDHEAGNPCRNVILSSYYACFPPLDANVTVQQCQVTGWFIEAGCFEQDKAEDKEEAAAIFSCTADEDLEVEDYSSIRQENVLPASKAWTEERTGVALPTLQMGGSAEGETDLDRTVVVESGRGEEELDYVTFPILRLAGREGVAEEPDPAAFISQLDVGEELEECEAPSPFRPIDWNDAAGEAYALQAPARTSLAIRGTDEQHDIFYKQYMERMGWFDRLNCERIYQTSALLNMDIGDPSFLENIEAKITSVQGTTVRDLIKSIESDLETVYVAQSCLGWAVLHHQYRAVESLASSSSRFALDFSRGNVTGRFQQFRVLLGRYMENECREAKRVWNYSKSRSFSVNLLQVPDVSGFGEGAVRETTMAASDVLEGIEKAIRVFRDFLESDNCRPSGKLKKLLWINPQVEDPRDLGLLEKLKKQVHKKDRQLKDLQKTRRRWWKAASPAPEAQGIEILFSWIDVKLVSRVLRMPAISTHQLGWCQDRLESIQINEGRMVRLCNGTFLFPSS